MRFLHPPQTSFFGAAGTNDLNAALEINADASSNGTISSNGSLDLPGNYVRGSSSMTQVPHHARSEPIPSAISSSIFSMARTYAGSIVLNLKKMGGIEETFPTSPMIPSTTSIFANICIHPIKVSCSTPTSAEGGLPTSTTNPDENKIVTYINHITLKPYEQTYGVHGGKVTDDCPDASVPYDSCVSCSTPSTTNHDHTCEWGGFQRYIQVLTAQPTSLGHRVFNQIRLLSATLCRLQHK